MDSVTQAAGGGQSAVLESVAKVCKEVLAGLIEADGGHMYLVSATVDDVHIHLSGTCAGCPGAAHTRARVIAPMIEMVVPKARLRVTTGWILPEGAVPITPSRA